MKLLKSVGWAFCLSVIVFCLFCLVLVALFAPTVLALVLTQQHGVNAYISFFISIFLYIFEAVTFIVVRKDVRSN